ncbi:MAG: tryptophan--tRNA ligase [Acidimicrobiia bacterium]
MARIFSGIQPSGDAHLGNYLGALLAWVADQRDNEAIYCVVDLHAITVDQRPGELPGQTLRKATELLAAGLDPAHCILFVQSHVPEHTGLAWLLNCIAGFGELQRMTQFKDKSAGRESVSMGLFGYPVLMAADILLYDAERVPVGDDQRQHLELTRDVATRFNHRFGRTFVVPEAAIPVLGARIMDLQNPTAKMSKSTDSPQGTLSLLDSPVAIAKKVRSAMTDPGPEVRYDPVGKPGVSNLLNILAAVTARPVPALEAEYSTGGYARLKAAVTEAVVECLAPVRQRFEELDADPGAVQAILKEGAAKAAAIAGPVLERARSAIGLLAREPHPS